MLGPSHPSAWLQPGINLVSTTLQHLRRRRRRRVHIHTEVVMNEQFHLSDGLDPIPVGSVDPSTLMYIQGNVLGNWVCVETKYADIGSIRIPPKQLAY